MRKWVSTFAAGVAGAALIAGGVASGALAQDTASEEARFDEAFPEMVSEPLVQGDLAAPGPMIQEWDAADTAALIDVIEGIGTEGLDPADYNLGQLRTLAQAGPSDALNALASRNFVWLVEDLRDGRTPAEARVQWFVVDPDRNVNRTRDLLGEAIATGDIEATLMGLNPTHPDYAKLREELANTPESETAKRKLIRANMDRWRWLAQDLGSQYLITNVPEFQLRLTVGDRIISTYRTVVGKPGRTATPQLAETVSGVVFNPTWTVPQSIVRGEGLGERVLNNPAWARRNGYTATRTSSGWISVVQQPGPGNSNNTNRALSHGCIRTERALELAITMAILGQGATRDEAVAIATSGEYTKVPIEKEMPAYITYFTMGTDIEGEMRTYSDIYNRDAPVLASLDQPRVQNRSGESDDEVIVIENNPLAGD